MKILILLLAGAPLFAQSGVLTGTANWVVSYGDLAPDPNTCLGIPQLGSIYVRTQNANNGPVGVLRCTQVAGNNYSWQPIDHLVLPNLPPRCVVGDLGYQTATGDRTVGMYVCAVANVWSSIGSGGGLPGPTNGTNGQGLTSNGVGAFGTPVTLAPSATIDTTNASNISSGTLPDARLSTVNSTVGVCGDSSHVSQITLDAKGRATNCTSIPITTGTLSYYPSGLFSGPDTSRTILGATHGLVFPLIIMLYDNSNPRVNFDAGPITVNPTNYNVTVTFASPQTAYFIDIFGAPAAVGPTLSWSALTNIQWTGMNNTQWTTMTN